MKTVAIKTQSSGITFRDIKRVEDEQAEKLVKNQGYSFVPKSVWKKYVRDKAKWDAKNTQTIKKEK